MSNGDNHGAAIAASITESCLHAGLDIVHPFSVSSYNASVSADSRLETFGLAEPLGVLLGNTRALWPVFTRSIRQEPELASREHPLEAYLQARLEDALRRATPRPRHIYWAHDTVPRAFPIQRLAELVGLASLSPSHLSVHPEHGPWFALRAVVVIDVLVPKVKAAPLASPCAPCAKPCVPALERALAASEGRPCAATVAAQADAWIAIRDACPVGKGARYGASQLGYHYTKDRALLG